MKKFFFPLEHVLVWRRLELEREEAMLQRCLAERNALAAREAATRKQRIDSERLISGDRYIDSHFVATLPNWQSSMKRLIASLGNELVAADQKLTQQQAKYFQAKRRVGLLERLRENRLDAWKIDLGREEEAFAAEVFLAKSIGLARSNRRALSSRD